MASVKVAVRVRPFNKRELDLQCQSIIRMNHDTTTILPKDGSPKEGKHFTFDHSYWSFDSDDPHYASQEQVFEDVGQEVVESAFEGYNASIFAYGQTGSGKTYTMMGHQGSDGLIPRICKAIFQRIEASRDDTKYNLEVSYLEIYNEKVRDLLSERSKRNAKLKVRQDPDRGPFVDGLSRHVVLDYGGIQELMHRGNQQRTTASTNMNDTSSRSHAIFTLTFSQASFSEETERVSRIHLVDLAGSERADTSGAVGVRLKEGAHINQSLVHLGIVISTLAEKALGHKKGQDYINYRNSVLTWLLKDSLGGNSKTLMIANISPADCNHAETMSTLIYANRAKNIINKPTVNEDPNVKLIRKLKDEIAQLQSLLKNSQVMSPSKTPVMEQIQQHEAKVKELREEWTEKWRETHDILREQQALGLRKSGGHGVVLDSEKPHLIGVDGDWFSTGLTLYPLSKECTLIGTAEAEVPQDIVLEGPDILPEHCSIQMPPHNGAAMLVPQPGAKCAVNDVPVTEPTVLSQGNVLLLGDSHQFRYNNPSEVEQLKRNHRNSLNLSRLSLLSPSVSDLYRNPSVSDLYRNPSVSDLYRNSSVSEMDCSMVRQDVPPDKSVLEDPPSTNSKEEDLRPILNKDSFTKALAVCLKLITQVEWDEDNPSVWRELERHLDSSSNRREVRAKVLQYLEGLPEQDSAGNDTTTTSQEDWAHQLSSYLSEHSRPDSSSTIEDSSFVSVPLSWSSISQSPARHSSLHDTKTVTFQIPAFHLCGLNYHTHYKYNILVSVPGERWVIFRRFRRFQDLHKEMRFKMGNKIRLPTLPPRKILWYDPERVAMERRPLLETYLQQLVGDLLQEGLIQDSKESLCNLSDFFSDTNFGGCCHPVGMDSVLGASPGSPIHSPLL